MMLLFCEQRSNRVFEAISKVIWQTMHDQRIIGMTNARNAGNILNVRQRIREHRWANLAESCWVCFSSQDCPRDCRDPGRSRETLWGTGDFWSSRPNNRSACCAPLAKVACLRETVARWSISCRDTCIPEERIQVDCSSILLPARRDLKSEGSKWAIALNIFHDQFCRTVWR